MDDQAPAEILRLLQDVPDPRGSNSLHRFSDILTIALLAVLCGAEGWVDVVDYAECKLDWLKSFLELPYGIPSHDTFGRVFSLLDPDPFEQCLRNWMRNLVDLSGGRLVAIDGKSLRRSYQQAWDKSGMAHMVSAFVSANHVVLGQLKTDGKDRNWTESRNC